VVWLPGSLLETPTPGTGGSDDAGRFSSAQASPDDELRVSSDPESSQKLSVVSESSSSLGSEVRGRFLARAAQDVCPKPALLGPPPLDRPAASTGVLQKEDLHQIGSLD